MCDKFIEKKLIVQNTKNNNIYMLSSTGKPGGTAGAAGGGGPSLAKQVALIKISAIIKKKLFENNFIRRKIIKNIYLNAI